MVDEVKEGPKYTIRADIEQDGKVRCPSFTVPLMDFNEKVADNQKDKKPWKGIYDVVCDKRSSLPLSQMMLKQKHED